MFDLHTIKQGYSKDTWFTDPQCTHERQNLVNKNGLWYQQQAIVVPKYLRLRTWIMQEFHDSPYAGHMGVSKTLQLIKRYYWWPRMKQDVAKYIKHCPSCQRCKSTNDKSSGLLKPLPIPTTPWTSISVDFITDLPETNKGYNSIMVVVDRLTKMTHFVPTTKDVTTEGVAHLFKREIFRLHGVPDDIVSDRDPKFVSNFWKEFTQLLGTTRNLSTSFHPRAYRQTERMNRFLDDVLRH